LVHGRDVIVSLSLRSLAPNLNGTCDPVVAMHDNQSGALLGQTERITYVIYHNNTPFITIVSMHTSLQNRDG
jgi:hypothetical protein